MGAVDTVRLLADPDTVIAVVGATDTPGKFGGRIYRDLKAKGYRVVAVNPNRATVDGDRAYPSLSALPESPDLIDMVVPAGIGESVADEVRRLGLDNVWLQPGAESSSLMDRLTDNGVAFVSDRCIMVETAPLTRSGD